MKQGSFRAVRLLVFLLVMMSMTVFSVSGDENTVDLMSIVLDPFDGTTEHSWAYGGRTYAYDFEWHLDASRFATQERDRNGNVTRSFPLKTVVPAWPMALYGANRNGSDINSLGIWGKFDRRGYNWIDVYPIVTGTADAADGPEAFEIPLPGRIQYLDMWAWGSNLKYYVEVFFRDYQGIVYGLRLGDLSFQGWKNLRIRIPTSIPQSKRILPRHAGLTFVKFRIWTTPMERVDNFYIYFNQLKVLTDTFESLFDGDELADPDRVQELWAQD
jgi:hypothetical protein